MIKKTPRPGTPPLRDVLRALPPAQVRALLAGLSAEELLALRYDWATWARPEQLPPDDDPSWSVYLSLGGRGSGKSRSGAEWVRKMVREHPGCRVALVGRTSADVRDVMIEGEAGLLSCCPPAERPEYLPSVRRLVWRNGSVGTAFAAAEGDQLRGPSHHFAWADEWCAWPDLEAVHANMMLGLRLGGRPRLFISTTPRPSKLLRSLLDSPTTITRRGSTYANAANLPASALREFTDRYANTRLGRQELFAEILDDLVGALWSRSMLDDNRVKPEEVPELVRVVVAVDPAVTSGEESDETGILVVARDGRSPPHFYVLADRSCRLSPDAWARRVLVAYQEFQCDRVIGETNNGGDLIEATLRTVNPSVPFTKVTATRAKRIRAEPCSALYEQSRVHHVGTFPELEDQMCVFVPDAPSGMHDDRLDALVWGLTELAKGRGGAARTRAIVGGKPMATRSALPAEVLEAGLRQARAMAVLNGAGVKPTSPSSRGGASTWRIL